MRVGLILWAVGALAWGAAPDQVLVLYNADWTEDLDGTEPGQDSLEVARYYVARRTDPETGKKPHLLGLHCADPQARRLNHMRLPEGSQDNRLGIRSTGDGSQPDAPPFSASLLVVFSQHEAPTLDPASLTIRVSPTGEEADAVVVYANGGPKPDYNVRKVEAAGRTGYGFAGRTHFPDGFTAWVEAKTKDGKSLRSFHARYGWPAQFEPDLTGPDGVRDDAHYLADMETPIKRFLEAPERALADGTLLRDHILYLVVCYGLPKQVECSFGVSRGVRGRCRKGADGSALEARLQLLYHDVRRYHQVTVLPWGDRGVHAGRIASRLRVTLAGLNPFRHPMAHRRRKGKGLVGNRLYPSYEYEAERIPHFTTAIRRQLGDRTLYIATRLDGRHPRVAKAQVDGALYGERYLTPFLGWFWHGTYSSARQAAAELKFLGFRAEPPAEPAPHERGRVLFYFGDFGYGVPCAEDPAEPPVPYGRGLYPGSVAYAVRSHLGWKLSRTTSQLYDHNSRYPERMLAAGATACVLSAHGAHDTSATWPDDQIFFHHLLRGYTLGECYLISTVYLDWLQSYVGDPLYRPALKQTARDDTPPRVASRDDLGIALGQADGRYWARVRPTLAVTRANPEMTDIAVTWWTAPERKRAAADWRFSRRPSVVLPDLPPESVVHLDVALTDPYGNRFSSAEAFGDVTIKTGPPPAPKRAVIEWRDTAGSERPSVLLAREGDDDPAAVPERGEIRVEFTARDDGFRLVSDDTRRFRLDSQGLRVGGRLAACCPPAGEKRKTVFEAGRRYTLIARWRREPVVRQVVLVARDGREFLLGSNNRQCWLPEETGEALRLRPSHAEVHRIVLYDDTRPQPLDPLYPACFDLDAYHRADGRATEEEEAGEKAAKDGEGE
ncbi:MAG: hypothetical protein ACOC8D_01485 [bacterium]